MDYDEEVDVPCRGCMAWKKSFARQSTRLDVLRELYEAALYWSQYLPMSERPDYRSFVGDDGRSRTYTHYDPEVTRLFEVLDRVARVLGASTDDDRTRGREEGRDG